MPYILSAALLFVAFYPLYKAVRGCLDPIGARFEMPLEVFRNVLGLTGTVAGMSLIARIPRLAPGARWRLLAVMLATLYSAGYFLISAENRGSIEAFLTGSDSLDPYLNLYNRFLIGSLLGGAILFLVGGLRPVMLTLLPVVLAILLIRCASAPLVALGPAVFLSWPWRSLAVIAVAWLIGLRAWRVSWLYPSLGTKPLVHTGGLIILLIVATEFAFHRTNLSAEERAAVDSGLRDGDRVAIARAVADEIQEAFSRITGVYRDREPARQGRNPDADLASDRRLVRDASGMQIVADAALDEGPVWPVVIAGAAYLYLWWLAIVLFDLTFVWHVYIRWAGAQRFVDTQLGPP